MRLALVIDALGIPPGAIVEQRVPKKLLLDHGAPTAADKRQIQDGIEEIVWMAALKPTNIGVPAFEDLVRQYLEIAVLTVELRPAARPTRLIELIHRAIPYPLVLITEHSESVFLSLAHKRWSQGEAGKVVIDEVRQTAFNPDAPSAQEAAFLASLAVSRLPSQDLYTFMMECWPGSPHSKPPGSPGHLPHPIPQNQPLSCLKILTGMPGFNVILTCYV